MQRCLDGCNFLRTQREGGTRQGLCRRSMGGAIDASARACLLPFTNFFPALSTVLPSPTQTSFLCEKVKSIAARVAKAKVFLAFAAAPYCRPVRCRRARCATARGLIWWRTLEPHGGSIPAQNCLLQCSFVKRRALQTACRNALCRPAATSPSALTCTHTTTTLAVHFHVLAAMVSKQRLQQSKTLDQWEGGIFVGKLQNDSNNHLDLRTCINPPFKPNLSSNPTSLSQSNSQTCKSLMPLMRMRACHVCAPCVPCELCVQLQSS